MRLIDPALDPARIVAHSEGNPLFALELARAHLRGDTGPGSTVESVIAGQLARLSEGARECLMWATAYGRHFTPATLMHTAGLDGAVLMSALDALSPKSAMRLNGIARILRARIPCQEIPR